MRFALEEDGRQCCNDQKEGRETEKLVGRGEAEMRDTCPENHLMLWGSGGRSLRAGIPALCLCAAGSATSSPD